MDESHRFVYQCRMAHDLPFADLRLTTPPRFFYWNRDFHWAPPAMLDFDLWCIFEGRGEVLLRDQTYELVPGLCFVFRPGDRPQARHDPAHPLVAFYGHFDLLDARGRKVPASRVLLPPPAMHVRDLPWFHALARRCATAAQRGDSLGQRQSRLALEQMLAQVWEWWQTQPPQPADATIANIIREIQRLPGHQWKVAEMARQARLSRAQFTRRFKTLTGQAPKALVIQTRLELARQLILETSMSLSQIATDLGYQNLYFFSRQFKQHFAQPPSQLRTVNAPTATRSERGRTVPTVFE